jgi:hypothetical protein
LVKPGSAFGVDWEEFMSIFVRSNTSHGTHSFDTGMQLARHIVGGLAGEQLKGILAYSTVNHDQTAFLNGIREIAGTAVPVFGCSSQGIVGQGTVVEDGYAAGAMGLGGTALDLTSSHVEEFQTDTVAKAHELGKALREQSAGPLRAVIIYYDPLCGADVEAFLKALHEEVQCELIGGAAAEFWGPMQQTFQYVGSRALNHAAVAVGLSGSFTMETDLCHGTIPVGIEMTVTKSAHNTVLEFDGRPALEVWQEFCAEAPERIDHSGAIGIGLPTKDPEVYLVRCAFGVDTDRLGVIFQSGIPTGTRVMFNHRTVHGAVDGTAAMGRRLVERLKGKTVRGVLGFECGARTKPFLGKETTLAENRALQAQIAPNADWLGMMAWGEVSLFDGQPGFVNFSYPILILAD